jgi:Fe-S cluster assembly protein SufD
LSDITTRKSSRDNTGVGRNGSDSVSTHALSPIEAYRADFQSQPPAPEWLQSLRAQGMARFQALGFPTTKNEDWHFTSVAPIAEQTFRAAMTSKAGVSSEGSTAGMVARADLKRFMFGEPAWHTLVFVNGEFSEDLSSYAALGEKVRVSSLAKAIRAGTGRPERHLGKIGRAHV